MARKFFPVATLLYCQQFSIDHNTKRNANWSLGHLEISEGQSILESLKGQDSSRRESLILCPSRATRIFRG